MQLSLSAYVLLPFFALLLALAMANRAWRYRPEPIGKTFLVLMVMLAWWSICVIMEYITLSLAGKVFWVEASYLSVVSIPVAWLVFTLQYTDRSRWVRGRNLLALTAIPIVTIAMAWTNNLHHLMWSRFWLDVSVSPPVDAATHGWWFWVNATYAYLLLVLGATVLAVQFRKSSGMHRRQTGVLLLAALLPWCANVLYLAGVRPFNVVDPTPLAFALTGLGFFWAISRLHLLDILPVAHEAVLKSMADGEIVLDNQQRVVDLNPAAERITGLRKTEAIGRDYRAVLPGHAALLPLTLETGEARVVVAIGQAEAQRYYEVSITSIVMHERLHGHLLLLRDDTERMRAEVALRERMVLETELNERSKSADQLVKLNEELNSLNAQLETKVEERTRDLEEAVAAAKASDRAKSEFLASMSHELRTPLNSIIGFSQVLQEQYFGSLNEKQAEYMSDIVGSGKHLLSLINDILDLSKIEAGKMELEMSRVKIAELVRNSLVMVKEKALAHGISLDLEIPSDLETTETDADERRMKQVMFNLLSNAAKFTPDGGRITVAISRNVGQDLEVSVSDTGIGMTPEEQKRLFEAFYQASGGIKDKTPGTGLGLAISRSIVEKHGGRMWMQSDGPNKGSRFAFSLPLAESVKPAEPLSTNRPHS